MRHVGTVSIIWRNGEDDFCLSRIGDILHVEEKCGAGIMTIMRRLESDSWYVNDIRETIRIGLIGGGKTPEQAMLIVKRCVDENPNGIAPSVLVAHTIIRAALIGVPGDEVGKEEAAGAKDPASTTMTDASAALQSSASPELSSGASEKSMSAPSGKSPHTSTGTTEQTEASNRPST